MWSSLTLFVFVWLKKKNAIVCIALKMEVGIKLTQG